VLPVCVVDAVVVVVSLPEAVLSGVRRFMVGRSGSSAGVDVVVVELVAEPWSGVVPDAVVVVPELSRRFMVGRSGSLLVGVLDVLDAVVASGLFVVWVAGGLLWSLPAAGAVSPLVFVTR
jgi:hypothetical protein